MKEKCITFRRIFKLRCDLESYVFIDKDKSIHTGETYEDFIENNRYPLHSFLMSKEAINGKKLTFVPGIKYMEDYYLNLHSKSVDP